MKKFEDIDITKLTAQTMKYSSTGMIDSTLNMLYDRVYIFDGLNDTTVMPGQSRICDALVCKMSLSEK